MNIEDMVTATASLSDLPQFLAEAAVTLGHGRLRALGGPQTRKPQAHKCKSQHTRGQGVLTNGNERPTGIGGQVKERHRAMWLANHQEVCRRRTG